MKRIMGLLKDRPKLVTMFILFFVILQIVLIKSGVVSDFSEVMRKNDKANDLYLAMLSVAALQASFAGVIVVFGLSNQPKAFRNLRTAAGKVLVDNWMSISYSGFLSAGFALFASLSNIITNSWLAPWFFEASVLFCAHGIIRLLWLLKQLIKVVRDVDSWESLKASER